ncbi:hypothetical protein M422DRAFT_48524 [Sphaerobolus stellatus SS14]|uniref:Uncharacterized protein n=1 Tax=Sphaerobolus stellatus (strain SS14) TaxID=990650 RepID=A0A0C9VJ74_SPHS4|nr:hypothetical protein M422DRAFT_48524 [Sphaerobolus stellatus SS14]
MHFMDYPCTRGQTFYYPITNRLAFSPERSVTPPIITNRLEFHLEEDSVTVNPMRSSSQGTKLTTLNQMPPKPPSAKVDSSPAAPNKSQTALGSSAKCQPAPEAITRRHDHPSPAFEMDTSDEDEIVVTRSSDLSVIPENVEEEESSDSDSSISGAQADENPDRFSDDQSSSDLDFDEPQVPIEDMTELKNLSWSPEGINDVTTYLRKIAPKYINIHLSYARQDTEKVAALFRKNNWPLKDFVQAHIKYARDKTRTGEVEAGPSRAKGDVEADTENSTTKRRRIEHRSSSIARSSPAPKGKGKNRAI